MTDASPANSPPISSFRHFCNALCAKEKLISPLIFARKLAKDVSQYCSMWYTVLLLLHGLLLLLLPDAKLNSCPLAWTRPRRLSTRPQTQLADNRAQPETSQTHECRNLKIVSTSYFSLLCSFFATTSQSVGATVLLCFTLLDCPASPSAAASTSATPPPPRHP